MDFCLVPKCCKVSYKGRSFFSNFSKLYMLDEIYFGFCLLFFPSFSPNCLADSHKMLAGPKMLVYIVINYGLEREGGCRSL
jgi:hypothetical protein